MSRPQNFDFDPAYRGEATDFGARPPWSLGVPQPEISALIDAGLVRSEVLDAGCGEAALSLDLAGRGYQAVGIDLSLAAIESARSEARRRSLTNAEFAVADITNLHGYDGRFSTIIDSALFHSMPVELRDDYQRSMVRAASPGARYFILVFDGTVSNGAGPNAAAAVTRDELAAAVKPYWEIDDIRPARHHCIVTDEMAARFGAQLLRDESDGRKSLPAWLLSAHNPG